MGAQLSEVGSEIPTSIPSETDIPVPPWIDPVTADLARAIIASVAHDHPDLRAVILYGSIARHEERPLDDPEPSDVDLLLLFDLDPELDRIPYEQDIAISRSIGIGRDHHPDAPREVQVVLAVRDLADWDPTFVQGVTRDGMLLWARGPLPEPLAAVISRRPLPPAS